MEASAHEWRVGGAALGTPDPGIDDGVIPCNTGTTGAVAGTGSRKQCRPDVGALVMVGNVVEFAGDWGHATRCGTWASWSPSYGNDNSCMGVDRVVAASVLPAATLPGGGFVPRQRHRRRSLRHRPERHCGQREEVRAVPVFVAHSKLSSFPTSQPSCLAVQVHSLLEYRVRGALARLHRISLGSRSILAIESDKTIPPPSGTPRVTFGYCSNPQNQ